MELEDWTGDEEFRDPPTLPKAKRFPRDMRRPPMPRRRAATWSFQVAVARSMLGIMDWATSSRMNVRRAVISDSKR